jgi:hypothetical protein
MSFKNFVVLVMVVAAAVYLVRWVNRDDGGGPAVEAENTPTQRDDRLDPHPMGLRPVSRARQGTRRVPIYERPGVGDARYTQECVRVKALCKYKDVPCLDEPGGLANDRKLEFFRPYFVLRTSPEIETDGGAIRESDLRDVEYVLLSTTPNDRNAVGWARARDVQVWVTRLLLRLLPPADDHVTVSFNVYQSQDDLTQFVRTGSADRPPIARASFNSRNFAYFPWPILNTQIIQHDGQTCELFQIAFLGEVGKGQDLAARETRDAVGERPEKPDTPPEPTADQQRLLAATRKLYLVFCMDTTSSTTPYIEAMKQAVREICTRIGRMPARVRPEIAVRLVEYRDYVEGLGFVTKGHTTHTSLRAFLQQVGTVRAAEASSEDWPEAVFDGMHDALHGSSWGERIAARCVILIGDDSGWEAGEAKNKKNISQTDLIAYAKQRNIRIYSVCVPCRSPYESERQRHRRQFEAFARGTRGTCQPLSEASRTAESIKKILIDQSYRVHAKVLAGHGMVEGKTEEEIKREFARDRIPDHLWTDVMRFMGRFADELRPGERTYATGWVVNGVGGLNVVGKEVYCYESELNTLLGELFRLKTRLTARDVGRLASDAVDFRVGEYDLAQDEMLSFFESDASADGVTMAVYYRSQVLPLPSTRESILNRNTKQLLHMSQAERDRLRSQLEVFIRRIEEDMRDKRRFHHKGEPGLVRESSLP